MADYTAWTTSGTIEIEIEPTSSTRLSDLLSPKDSKKEKKRKKKKKSTDAWRRKMKGF